MSCEICKIFKSSGIVFSGPIQFEKSPTVMVWDLGCDAGFLFFSYIFSGLYVEVVVPAGCCVLSFVVMCVDVFLL